MGRINTCGRPVAVPDHLALAIRRYYDSGNVALLRSPLAALAAYLDRLGHHEPAATISGFAATPFIRTVRPEITTAITHLREVLGDQTYESLARKGEMMTTAAMVTYAYDQIDQARAELEAVSEGVVSRLTRTATEPVRLAKSTEQLRSME